MTNSTESRAGRAVRSRHSGWKGALAAAAAILLALAGPTSAQAAWVTGETALTASASSGSLDVTLSGFGALAKSYTSAGLTTTATVTVGNTGSVPSPYTLTFGAQTAGGLADATVQVWPVSSAARCTAGATPVGQRTGSWTTVGAVSGALAPQTVAAWCVRSSVTQAQRFALAGATVTATASVVAAQGNWTSSTTATAAQSVANTLTPGAATKTSQTDRSISLAWTAPADTAAVTRYRVFRDGEPIATVPVWQGSYTDTGLAALKSYTYTVAAIDSSTPVNVSPTSPAAIHATNGWSASAWYRVINVGTGLCVDAEGGHLVENIPLISYSCNGGNNQAWQFGASGSYTKVTPKGSSTLYWDTLDSNGTNRAVLRSTNNTSRQRWTVTAVGSSTGTFTLSDGNGLCLDVNGATTSGGNPQLTAAKCVAGSVNQIFSLTNAG